MSNFLKISITIIFLQLIFFWPVASKATYYNAIVYDEILEIPSLNKESKYPPRILELPPSEGQHFPDLNGIWIMKKETTGRREPSLIIPVKNTFCLQRLPLDDWNFEREVVLSDEEFPGKFSVRPLYVETRDIYYNPNNGLELNEQNFNFKAELDPEDITYAYTLRLANFIENPTNVRDVWMSARLYYEHVSKNFIKGKGYEVIWSPECHGFILDFIKVELTRMQLPAIKLPFVSPTPEFSEIPPAFEKLKDFDTVKDKSDFEPAPVYEPLEGINVPIPGLW